MNIAFFTSNRSEWGLLKPLYEELNDNCHNNISVIACNSHLSFVYGMTIDDIKNDMWMEEMRERLYTVESLLSSDTTVGMCKSMGLIIISLTEKLNEIKPNFVILLGDRYESMICATVCHAMRIKILHLHGGEQSGNIDDAYRDCISRMSYVHCTATQNAKLRLQRIDRGFLYHRVYNVGALGCQGLVPVEKRSNYLLVVYHPNTLDYENIGELLRVLSTRNEPIEFITANCDAGGEKINNSIREFCRNRDGVSIIPHLERSQFIDLLSKAKAIVGNSSAGIIEAPCLHVPTINIGSRQKNRELASSIIDCPCTEEAIDLAFYTLDECLYDLSHIAYQGGDVVGRIKQVIKNEF